MTWLPDRIYRHDRQREAVWELLDNMPFGRAFTLDALWRGLHGPCGATYSMTRNVVNDAVRFGWVERVGRLTTWQGGPNVYRRIR